MSRFFNRWQNRIRWRLHARVAPVMAVALLVLGGLGWWGAHQTALRALDEANQLAVLDLARAVRTAALVEALDLDAGVGGQPRGAVLAVIPRADADLIKLDRTLDTALNRTRVADWLAARIAADGRDAGWPRPEVLTGMDSDAQVSCHAPLVLDGAGSRDHPVLPVVLRRGDGEQPVAVGLLDPAALVPMDHPHGEWWCLLTADGRVLAEYPATTIPADLRRQAMATLDESTFRGPDGWLVTRFAVPNLPFGILVAGRPTPVSASFRTLQITLVALVLLALLGAGYAADHVMRGVARRLTGLGEAMEDLARGNDSRRLEAQGSDDVTRVESWFNIMATSLDEAHRTVNEKEAHLSTALENMRMLDQAKDDFLVLVSHEVRTPLTCIMGGLDHLESVLAKAQDTDRDTIDNLQLPDVVDVISSSSRRLNDFLTDALQITALQSGGRCLELGPLTLANLLEPALANIRDEAAGRNITITDELSGQCDWMVLADARILQVAVTKLLDNAIRHNEESGQVILREVDLVPDLGTVRDLITPEGIDRLREHPTFEHWADEDLRWRILEVYNTGPAIPADRTEALFAKFEVVEPIANHGRGTGLSLPIARAAVEQHGGRLLMTSSNRDGTSFYVLLPTLQTVAVPADPRGLWDDLPQRCRGRASDEEIGVVAHAARFDIELDDRDAPVAGEADQPGGGVDGAGRPDHEKEPAF